MLALLIRLTLYTITLIVYTPYLVYSIRQKYYSRFPIVFFTFLGMFFYNAIGSIYVFVPHLRVSVFDTDYFSNSFALMLNLQALMFYLVTLPYTLQSRTPRHPLREERTARPFIFLVIIAAIGTIIFLYVRNVGVPPGVRIITGGLTTEEVIQFRIAGTFALTDYYIYNVGFMTLPVILSALACTLYLQKPNKIYIFLILGCMAVTTFPGGKGNVARISILLLIMGLLHRLRYPKLTRSSRKVWTAAFLVVTCTSLVVLAMYRIYYGADVTGGQIVNAICYKVFGSVPETIGGLINYCAANGFLDGKTLPDFHGFLGHETFDMNTALHVYMFGPGGMTAFPAVTEGYINFGWSGFIAFCAVTYAVVIAIDRMFAWLPQTELTFSLMAVCCLIATEVSQLSLSATFVSLTLSVVIGSLLVLDRFGVWISRLSFMADNLQEAGLRS